MDVSWGPRQGLESSDPGAGVGAGRGSSRGVKGKGEGAQTGLVQCSQQEGVMSRLHLQTSRSNRHMSQGYSVIFYMHTIHEQSNQCNHAFKYSSFLCVENILNTLSWPLRNTQ